MPAAFTSLKEIGIHPETGATPVAPQPEPLLQLKAQFAVKER